MFSLILPITLSLLYLVPQVIPNIVFECLEFLRVDIHVHVHVYGDPVDDDLVSKSLLIVVLHIHVHVYSLF